MPSLHDFKAHTRVLEVYHDRKKDAAWKVSRAKEAVELEQTLVREKLGDVQELRQEKRQQAEEQKLAVAEEGEEGMGPRRC